MRAQLDPEDVEKIATRVVELLRDELREQKSEGQWLNTREAAEHLRLSVDGLHRLSGANAVPHVKVSGRLLFEREELDRWLRSHAVADASVSLPFPPSRKAA